MAADLKHLKLRRKTWFVRVKTPRDLRDKFGHEVVRTTGATSLREAQMLRHEIVGKIMADFLRARGSDVSSVLEAQRQKLISDARALAAQFSAVNTSDPEGVTAEELLRVSVEEALSNVPGPRDEGGYPVSIPRGLDQSIRTAYRVAAGDEIHMLGEEIERYLAEIGTGEHAVTQQTLRIKRRILEDFLRFNGDVEMREVTKNSARRYLESELLPRGRSVKTTKDTLLHLSAFFNAAEARGRHDFNPFAGLSKTVRKSTRGGVGTKARKEWTSGELYTFLTKVDRFDTDHELNSAGRARRIPGAVCWAMTAIAAYTGMRENEIAELRLKDVQSDRLHVREGKTQAAVRTVPLHPCIRPLVAHLKATAADEYLIPHLTRGGYDNRRAWNFAKKFSRLRQSERVGVERTFHELRHTANTMMLRAGVPQEVREEVLGHEGDDDVNKTYAHGAGFKVLAGAVAKISYGKKLDGLVRGAHGGSAGGRRKKRSS